MLSVTVFFRQEWAIRQYRRTDTGHPGLSSLPDSAAKTLENRFCQARKSLDKHLESMEQKAAARRQTEADPEVQEPNLWERFEAACDLFSLHGEPIASNGWIGSGRKIFKKKESFAGPIEAAPAGDDDHTKEEEEA